MSQTDQNFVIAMLIVAALTALGSFGLAVKMGRKQWAAVIFGLAIAASLVVGTAVSLIFLTPVP